MKKKIEIQIDELNEQQVPKQEKEVERQIAMMIKFMVTTIL